MPISGIFSNISVRLLLATFMVGLSFYIPVSALAADSPIEIVYTPLPNGDETIIDTFTELQGDQVIKAKDILTVNDTLIIYGNLTFGSGGILNLNPGSVCIIQGNLDFGTDGILNIYEDALLIVYQDFNLNNKVNLSIGAQLIVGGDLTTTANSNKIETSIDSAAAIYVLGDVDTAQIEGFNCPFPEDYVPSTGSTECTYGDIISLEDNENDSTGIYDLFVGGDVSKGVSPVYTELCSGNSVSIIALDTVGQFYQWCDSAGNHIAGENEIFFTTDSAGEYFVKIVADTTVADTVISHRAKVVASTLDASFTIVEDTCEQGTGAITFTATGATGFYEYSIYGDSAWQSSPGFTNLSSGTYDVRVRDSLNPSCEKILDSGFILLGDLIVPLITSCPSDTTVDSQDSLCGAQVIYNLPTATDDCSSVIVTLIEGLASGDTFPVGGTTVSYELSDSSGNKDTCTFMVTVLDVEPPSIFRSLSLPDTIRVDNTPGLCGKLVTFAQPTAFDNCSGAILSRTSIDSSGTFFPIGITPVTYEAEDRAGFLVFDTIYVEVVDSEPPLIDTCPLAVYSTIYDTLVSFAALVPITSSDNCPGVNFDITPLNIDLSQELVSPINITATDIYGNTTLCDFNFTVQSTTPIIKDPDRGIVCAGTTVEFSFSGTWGSKSKWIVDGPDASIDDQNAQTANITFNTPGYYTIKAKIQETGQPTFYIDHMVVISDIGASATAQVTTDASVSGNPVCPGAAAPELLVTVNGDVPLDYQWYSNTSSSNSGGAIINGANDSIYVPDVSVAGTLYYYCVVSCVCNSSLVSNASEAIVAEDNEKPQISCFASDTVFIAETGVCGANINLPLVTATDNCPGSVTITNSFSGSGADASGFYPVDTTRVTYYAEDLSGNIDSCFVEVFVLPENNVPFLAFVAASTPKISDGGSIDFQAFGTHQPQTYSWSFQDGTPSTSVVEAPSGIVFNGIGFKTVELAITDACGTIATFTRDIEVTSDEVSITNVDSVFRVPDCVTEIIIEAWGGGGAGGGASASATDSVRGGAGGGGGGYTIDTFAVTPGENLLLDIGNGGIGNNIDVIDGESSSVTRESNGDLLLVAEGGKGGEANTSGGIPSGGAGGTGFISGDSGGNGATGFFILSGAGGDGANGGIGGAGHAELIYANGNDGISLGGGGGGGRSWDFPLLGGVSPTAGGNGADGLIVITYTTNPKPTAILSGDQSSCPNVAVNLTLELTGTAPWDITFSDGSNDIAVNGINTSTYFIEVAPNTTTTYTLVSLSDANCEGTVSGSATVTPEDNTDPIVTLCPGDYVFNVDPGSCGALVTYDEPIFADNCDGVSLAGTRTEGPASGTLFSIGETTIIYEYTDTAGNGPVTCSFQVLVLDNEAPSISCPENITVNNDPGESGAVINYNFPIITDNCTVSDTLQTAGDTSGALFPIGTTTNTFEVTDQSGNTAECSFTITVNDVEAPNLTCAKDTFIDALPGVCFVDSVVLNYPEITDNGRILLSMNSPTPPGREVIIVNNAPDTFWVGETIVTWTVTDAYGNSSQCTQTVTVEDIEPPVIICPADITVDNDPLVCGAVVSFSATATDNCGVTISYDKDPDTFFDIGTTTVTATASDTSGNTVDCSFTVTVNSTINADVSIVADKNTICQGETVVFTATPAFGGTSPFYQWQLNGTNVGNNQATFANSTLNNGDTVTCIMTSNIPCANNNPATSNSITISVLPEFTSGEIEATGETICSGGDPAVIVSVTDASGGDGTITYEWRADGTQIVGSNSATYDPPGGLTTTTTYTRWAKDNTCNSSYTQSTGSWVITVNALPVAPTLSGNGPICPGSDAVFTISGTVGNIVNYTGDATGSATIGALGTVEVTIAGATADVTLNLTNVSDGTCELPLSGISETIIVEDAEAPTITCPADQNVSFDINCEFVVPDYTDSAIVSDNCDPAPVVTQSPAIGSTITDTTTITLTVSDASGNTNNCTFDVNLSAAEIIDVAVQDLVNDCQDGSSDSTTISWSVTLEAGTNDWTYDYTINDGTTDVVAKTGESASGDITITYKFENTPGVNQSYTLTLSNVKDNCGIAETNTANNSDETTRYGNPDTGDIIPDN